MNKYAVSPQIKDGYEACAREFGAKDFRQDLGISSIASPPHVLEGQASFSCLENLWILLYSDLWWCWIPARYVVLSFFIYLFFGFTRNRLLHCLVSSSGGVTTSPVSKGLRENEAVRDWVKVFFSFLSFLYNSSSHFFQLFVEDLQRLEKMEARSWKWTTSLKEETK
ncbi:unnamed protein product [Brassica rapa subsp. narinosa]